MEESLLIFMYQELMSTALVSSGSTEITFTITVQLDNNINHDFVRDHYNL